MSADLPDFGGAAVFAVEYLPGQFDQRADSASECIQLISQGGRPTVRSAKVYALSGALNDADIEAVKHYVINPVEAREASLETKTTLRMEVAQPGKVEVIAGFNDLDDAGLQAFIDERGLAMDLADARFCQQYFRGERRNRRSPRSRSSTPTGRTIAATRPSAPGWNISRSMTPWSRRPSTGIWPCAVSWGATSARSR